MILYYYVKFDQKSCDKHDVFIRQQSNDTSDKLETQTYL
jgi:hypothetical protein